MAQDSKRPESPPPQYPRSEAEAEASSSPPSSPRPPPFSSLYTTTSDSYYSYTQAQTSILVPAYAPIAPEALEPESLVLGEAANSEVALPKDKKGEPSKKEDDEEPPPAYTEGSSPLLSFTYLMAATGGAASILTQVQQGGPPINTLGGKLRRLYRRIKQLITSTDVGADENITMDLRYCFPPSIYSINTLTTAQWHALHPLSRRAPNPPRIRPPLPLPQRSPPRRPRKLLPRRRRLPSRCMLTTTILPPSTLQSIPLHS